MHRIISMMLILTIFATPILADYKITQQTVLEGMTSETTIWAKGVRERRQSKMKMDDPETAAMMAKMMPDTIEISQCDLKQNVTVSDPKKSYFVDYYDWANPTPEQKKRRPVVKMVVKGTSTISSTVTDSGKRQMMFGLEAKWLKAVTTIENSADSCEGQANIKLEKEGWFVKLSLVEEPPKTPVFSLKAQPKFTKTANSKALPISKQPHFPKPRSTKHFLKSPPNTKKLIRSPN
jgi:hypothetical protein